MVTTIALVLGGVGVLFVVAQWLTKQIERSDRVRIAVEVEKHGGRVQEIASLQGGNERHYEVRYLDASGRTRHRTCLTNASLGVFWQDDEDAPELPVEAEEEGDGAADDAPPQDGAPEDGAADDAVAGACPTDPGSCGCAAPAALSAGSGELSQLPLLHDHGAEGEEAPRAPTAQDVPALVAELRSGDPRRCRAAIDLLAAVGTPALPALDALADDPDPDVRIDARQAASRIRDAAS